jgi:hypothetical protein
MYGTIDETKGFIKMFQAIKTTYHGPTNTRGALISAVAGAGRKSYPYPYALNNDQAHEKAAKDYAESFGWLDGYKLIGGQLYDGSYAFVLVAVSE